MQDFNNKDFLGQRCVLPSAALSREPALNLLPLPSIMVEFAKPPRAMMDDRCVPLLSCISTRLHTEPRPSRVTASAALLLPVAVEDTAADTAVATVVATAAADTAVDTEDLPRAVVATTARRLPAPALDTASRSLASRRVPAGRCVSFSPTPPLVLFQSGPSCVLAPSSVGQIRRSRGHDEKPLLAARSGHARSQTSRWSSASGLRDAAVRRLIVPPRYPLCSPRRALPSSSSLASGRRERAAFLRMIGVTRRREEKGVDAGRRCDWRSWFRASRIARFVAWMDGPVPLVTFVVGWPRFSARARALASGIQNKDFSNRRNNITSSSSSGEHRLLIVVAVVAITPPADYLPLAFHPSFARQNPVPPRLSGPQGLCSLGRSRHLCRH